MTYFGRVSEKVKIVLKKQNINMTFNTNHTLARYIENNKNESSTQIIPEFTN